MKRPALSCESTAAPVHWLKGETPLRAYRAQHDHCRQLDHRAREAGQFGHTGDDRRGAPGRCDGEALPPGRREWGK